MQQLTRTAARGSAAMLTLAGALLLTGCATVPTGPSVLVLPGKGKSFAQFQADNATCRRYASEQIGGTSAQRAANQQTLRSAGAGALLGGALGAALGDGRGAAVGAASGALFGAAASGGGYPAAQSAQVRYDHAYEQCMYAKGNRIPVAQRSAYGRRYYRHWHRAYYPPPPPPEDD